MSLESWLLFAFAITVASFSPGPNVLNVIVNTISGGVRGAAFTIAGNLICLFCVALLAAVGVGAVISTFPLAFTIMKIAGGLYLAWTGFKIIRSSFGALSPLSVEAGEETTSPKSAQSLMIEAFLISASNPKSILFLSAVFPQFLDTSAALAPQFSIMFATIITLVCLIHGLYALVAVTVSKRPASIRMRRWMARLTGTTFIGLGAGVAFSK